MSKYSKIFLSFFLGGTIYFLGIYFKYKSGNIELPGFLYTGLVSLAGLIITSLVILSKKVRKDTKNKKAG